MTEKPNGPSDREDRAERLVRRSLLHRAGQVDGESLLAGVYRRLGRRRWTLAWTAVAAVLLLGVGLVLHGLAELGRTPPQQVVSTGQTATRPAAPGAPGAPSSARPARPADLLAQGYMTARAATTRPEADQVTPGQTIVTAAGQRKRLELPDGSVLFVNQRTRLTVSADRVLSLQAGEVFVEVAARPAGSPKADFVVTTPQRQITALGTKFAVRVEEQGTGVAVTQGRVQVSGLAGVLEAGRQLLPGRSEPAALPRASHVLDWTRDLVAAADSPLVPANAKAGGALIVVDPNGQEVRLELRRYHVDVHIEDGFARTTIDQTYFNHMNWRLEGTFYFPLPADASLSRLAMYVNGVLMEGGMAERDYARSVYESIVLQRQDPALLEWIDGSTFKMRVFPLEGREEKRLILSYSQKLTTLYGQQTYRFPAGHNLGQVRDWSFHARLADGAGWTWRCDTHLLEAGRDRQDLLLDCKLKNYRFHSDVVVELENPAWTPDAAADAVRFNGAEHENSRYLMVRYQPALPVEGPAAAGRRDWVFLVETSAERDGLLARAQIEVVRTVLANAGHDDRFAVLTAGTRVRAMSDQLKPVTAKAAADAIAWLEKAHLIGALDLEAGLKAAGELLRSADNGHLVHLGSAVAVLGERRIDKLVECIPSGVAYVGVAVGRRWDRGLMKAAAGRTGGYLTQINPDEPVGWRAFELVSTLNTPRLMNLKVVDADEKVEFLTTADWMAGGEELCAMARLDRSYSQPRAVVVSGLLNGQPYRKVVPVENVEDGAGYLPRQWARLEIDRLVAENPENNKPRIVELSKAMYVMSPFTSLLVLETEEMYKQYNVDRGRKDHWAMYPAPAKIDVVREPLHGPVAAAPGPTTQPDREQLARQIQQVYQSVVVRVPPRFFRWPNDPGYQPPAVANLWDQMAWSASYGRRYGGRGSYELFSAGPDWMFFTGDDLNGLDGGWDFSGPLPVSGTLTLSATNTFTGTAGLTKVRAGNPKLDLGWAGDGTLDLNGRALSRLDALFALDGPVRGKTELWATNGRMGRESLRALEWQRIAGSDIPLLQLSDSKLSRSSKLLELDKRLLPRGRDIASEVTNWEAAFASRRLRGANDLGGGLDLDFWDFKAKDLGPWDSAFAWRGDGRRGGFSNSYGVPLLGKIPPLRRAFGQTPSASTQPDIGLIDPVERAAFVRTVNDQAAWLCHQVVTGRFSGRSYYQRPTWFGDSRCFRDLLSYAPAMSTTTADLLAVLEAECAKGPAAPTGQLDPAARGLIDRARSAGWQEIGYPAPSTQPAGSGDSPARSGRFLADGAGRFLIDRVLPNGLREQVLCDGETLYHVYPELGVAAQRTVSRFHRAELAGLTPRHLPAPDDLAREADVVAIDGRTVEVRPIGAADLKDDAGKPVGFVAVRLVFGADGRLAERRFIEQPAGKLLARVTCSPAGEVTLFDGQDKPLDQVRFQLRPAERPRLAPAGDLVVVPMPLRRPTHSDYAKMSDGELVTCLAAGQSGAQGEVVKRFLKANDRRVGLYLLLFNDGQWMPTPETAPQWADPTRNPLPANPDSPLARYMVHHAEASQKGEQAWPRIDNPDDGFIERLSEFRYLTYQWQSGQATRGDEPTRRAERARALRFVRDAPVAMGWALLARMLDYGVHTDDAGRMVEALSRFERSGVLAYFARYETIRLIHQAPPPADVPAGEREAWQRNKAADLFKQALAAGMLPSFDSTAYSLFTASDVGRQQWAGLWREAAGEMIRWHDYLAVADLASLCRNAGDSPLAQELIGLALAGADGAGGPEEPGRTETAWQRPLVWLAGVQYYYHAGQSARIDAILEQWLADEQSADSAVLWRMAGEVSRSRGRLAEAINRIERAMELEFAQLPDVVNAQLVAQEFSGLLAMYKQLADALTGLKAGPEANQAMLAGVIRAADRWRMLQGNTQQTCQPAAALAAKLGAPELGWEYLTTMLASRPNEGGPWAELARSLIQQNELELADRAFETAFQIEPTNVQFLWERAQLAGQIGRPDLAQRLYRQIVEGKWPPALDWIVRQARARLGPP